MGKLLQAQQNFASMVPYLLIHARKLGFEVTLGDAYRDARVHGAYGEKKSYSAAKSAHKRRLAIDLNLFQNGNYVSTTEGHAPLGLWWVEQGGIWGGTFPTPDGNHYEWPVEGID